VGVRLARLRHGLDSPVHTVLVVDDEPSIRMLCRLNLELDGWRVIEAGTIAEARERVAGADVVVLDVHLGSGSGIELLHELRRERPEVKVAMLTGSDRLDDIDSDAVIPKPFTLEQLRATVAGLAPRAARQAG
jgi:two-component system, OmpR family, response regulator